MTRESAVLFGLNGVLMRRTFDRARAKLAVHAPTLTLAALTELFSGDRVRAFQSGQLSEEQFLRGLAQGLGAADVSREVLESAWLESFMPQPDVERAAERLLERGHRCYLLANVDPIEASLAASQLPGLRRFSGRVLSYEERRVKPDPEFLQTALRRFGLSPTACVLLDADPAMIEVAKASHVPAHRFEGLAGAMAFLAEWGLADR